MNQQLKTILLTVLTISCLAIALIEISGISKTAFFNKFNATESQKAATDEIGFLPKTIIEFDNTRHDFGTLKEGDVVTHTFRFKNIGNKSLVISDVHASCGCTVPSYPKEAIPPESSGEITVQFDSKDQTGDQSKRVTVYSNAQQPAIALYFKAHVVK